MRSLLILLLVAQTATAQSWRLQKDSAKITIIEGLPAKQPFDTAKPWQTTTEEQVYIISDKDLYDYLGYATATKFKDVDFTTQHIIGEYVCRQCMNGCRHEEGQTACHRNRCQYGWVWWKRDNNKAFEEIPVTVLPGKDEHVLNGRLFLDDTLILSADTTRWLTTGFGDCHATFEYRLVHDRYLGHLLLIEDNIYGGCRAASSKPYTILFALPAGTRKHYKRTILSERRGD
ncbi:MAG: hypothetical protein JNM88_07600 [Chitinophagaceae bacterium]|nr:hypothetical protein [Chitinophagaceae bacterium]